ncbi:phospholipase A2 inhibitor and Ly6/PLAUR domain-containing protein-like [Pyxicephalus adspersus]|uniref:phospholipase A2 inhibitor and Ly6/PLAUR domain-containing protein-like n=1 Tax=Pyxicephalus adspersus TaxID=30357 RepID=UPI003B593CFA
MKILLVVNLVIFISYFAEALVCHKCDNPSGTTCLIYTNETCRPKIDRCFVTIMAQIIGQNISYQSSRGCAKYFGSCVETSTMTMGIDKKMIRHSKCCTEDHCNKEPIPIILPVSDVVNANLATPAVNSTDIKGNGLECPACMEKGNTCTSTGTVKCEGTQDKCFEFYGGLSFGPPLQYWTMKGCTNEIVCETCTRFYKTSFFLKGYNLTCSKN